MVHILLFLIGLGSMGMGWQSSQEIHRLAWGCTGAIAWAWFYLWSPAIIQIGFILGILAVYPCVRVTRRSLGN